MRTIVVQGLPFEMHGWRQWKLVGIDFWIEHDGDYWLLTDHRVGIMCPSKRSAIELLSRKLKELAERQEAADRNQSKPAAEAKD